MVVAAKELNRFLVGAELEKEFAEFAARRTMAVARGVYCAKSPSSSGA